jgi:type I restriction enzyme, R subunit
MRSYTNRSLDAAEIITELVGLAKQMRAEHKRGANLGLRDDELAFYDAVCQNDSATLELSDDTLKAIARELVSIVRRNTTVDWDKKEQVRASLRRHIRRLLTKYKYPNSQMQHWLRSSWLIGPPLRTYIPTTLKTPSSLLSPAG